jgi:hypothetical protein
MFKAFDKLAGFGGSRHFDAGLTSGTAWQNGFEVRLPGNVCGAQVPLLVLLEAREFASM